jgi:hypothetical protein
LPLSSLLVISRGGVLMTTRAVSGIELFDELPNAIVVEAWSFEEFLRGSGRPARR